MSTCIQIIEGMVPGINRLVARSDRCVWMQFDVFFLVGFFPDGCFQKIGVGPQNHLF